MKVFGREPALWLALLGAVAAALADKVPYFSTGQSAAAVALLTAALMAWTTKPAGPAVYVGLLTAGVALVAEYGVNVSDSTVANLTAVLLAGLALLGVRPQVSPQATAVSDS